MGGKLAAALREGAEQLVLLMVQQGWGVGDMDTLPLGVALPLQEALQRCRFNPPPGGRLGVWVSRWVGGREGRDLPFLLHIVFGACTVQWVYHCPRAAAGSDDGNGDCGGW